MTSSPASLREQLAIQLKGEGISDRTGMILTPDEILGMGPLEDSFLEAADRLLQTVEADFADRKLRIVPEEIVEIMARAGYESEKPFVWSVTPDDEDREIVREAMRAALSALRAIGYSIIRSEP